MKLLYKYIIAYFFKIFIVINAVIIVITSIYGLADIFLSFKEVSFKLGAKYVILLIPFVFYYLSPLSYTSASMILFKRLADRKIDLTSQSFGISPYHFMLPLILLSLTISLFHLLMNEKVYPYIYKEIKHIEEKYKTRKAEHKKVARDIWFLKKVHGDKVYVYIKTIEIDSGRFLNLLMLRIGNDDRVKEITEGDYGSWIGKKVNIKRGAYFNFLNANKNKKLVNESIEMGFDLKEISLLAERIEFLPSSSLLFLFSKGREIGIDVNQYLGELLYRIGISFFTFFLFIPTASNFLTSRKLKNSLIYFFFMTITVWFFIAMSKILPSEANITPIYVLFAYLGLLIYSLKRLYNMRKGVRI